MATTYEVTGATGGHRLSVVTWTVTLVGGDFTGTITATPGGGTGQCQIYAPSVITFTGDETLEKTFTFTPITADSVTYTFTNSGGLSNPSPITFTSTGLYLLDVFDGVADAALDGSSSDSIPGIAGGSVWTKGDLGTLRFVGSGGMAYLDTSAGVGTRYMSEAAMPSSSSNFAQGSTAGQLEIQFDFMRTATVAGTSRVGVIVMSNAGFTDYIWFHYEESGTPTFYLKRVDTELGHQNVTPPIGVIWRIKVNIVIGDLSGVPTNGYTTGYSWYSTDNGATWISMFSCSWLTSDNPTAFKSGIFCLYGGSATTGLHFGNLAVQDIPPSAPNCYTSKAYVSSSGRSIAFEFKRDSDNTVVAPTALNFLPGFFVNGDPLDVAFSSGVPVSLTNGSSTRAIILLADGTQVDPGDTVTMSAADSWMECGTGNAAAGLTAFPLTNYVGSSAFGTDTLTKTLKLGFNISLEGVREATMPIVMANLRYRLARSLANTSAGGYPTSIDSWVGQNIFMLFNDFADGGNGIDSTSNPGVPGYYAIGYDDTAYGTANQCTLSIRGIDNDGYGVWSNSRVTVTQISSCNNPGTNGVGQFYLFRVEATPGSPDANMPIGVNWYFPGFSTGTCTPGVTNLFILGPGDFTIPDLQDTSWSFDRSNPYRLSNHFLETQIWHHRIRTETLRLLQNALHYDYLEH